MGVKEGYPVKSRYFTAVGSSSVKTVADSHIDLQPTVTRTADELLSCIKIDDLERPRTPKIGRCSDFFLRFSAVAHTSRVNCDEIDVCRPR